MASSGKRKTTREKLMRESKLREKRAAKEARKLARRDEAEDGADSVAQTDDSYFGPLAEDRRPA